MQDGGLKLDRTVESTGETCRACAAPTRPLWRTTVLGRDVAYFECPACRFVQTETPYWLDEAYSSTITLADTGIMVRNLSNRDVTIATLWLLGGLRATVIDRAGGFGLLVRLLRDAGVEALHDDPFCENLAARGFEAGEAAGTLVTAFEAFEHFVDPDAELAQMLEAAPNVLLSTTLVPEPTPAPDDWWYYAREHGQHVSLYRASTLRHLAERHGKRLTTDGRAYHLISDRAFPAPLWKAVIRARRPFAALAAARLESKTWSDHLQMRAGR